MNAISAADVTRDAEDAPVRAALQSEFAYAERLRIAMLGWLAVGFLALLAVLEAAAAIGAQLPRKPSPAAEGVAVVAAVLLAALQFAIARGASYLRDDRARSMLWYAAALVEVGLIVGAWAIVGRITGSVRSSFPGLIAFTALVILSALRLDWRLTVFTAVLAAASLAFLHTYLGNLAPLDAPRSLAVEGTMSLLVVGALTALVAEQARRRTVSALRAIRHTQQLERDILHAEDASRSRIGRDLHDSLGGRLSGIAMMAQGLARRAEGGSVASASALRELAGLSLEGVEEVRRLARGLDAAPVALGLEEALRQLAERTTRAGVPCTFVADGSAASCDRTVTQQLYHIAQEATTNAVRHGAPSRVDVSLTVRPRTVTLDVRDDGIGIQENPEPGLGLRTMAQRAALVGAVLRIGPGPRGGTVMSCVLPR